MKEESAKQLNIKQDENNNYLINDRHQADYFINLSKQCLDDIEQIQQFDKWLFVFQKALILH